LKFWQFSEFLEVFGHFLNFGIFWNFGKIFGSFWQFFRSFGNLRIFLWNFWHKYFSGEDDAGGGGGTFSFGGVTVQRQTYSDDEDYYDEPGLTNMDANEFQYGYYGETNYNRSSSDDEEEDE